MYIRFVITQINEASHQPQGLFRAADTLLNSGDLTTEERKRLQDVLVWFNINLPAPNQRRIQGRVTFWFLISAQDCLRRMWEMVCILRAHDYFVEVHKGEHLHNCIYRDKYQVAAQPSPCDAKRTIK
jgi:hypothetical protein